MRIVLAYLRRGHKTKPCTKKKALAEQHGTWRKIFTSSRVQIKLRFTLLLNSRQCRRRFEKISRGTRIRGRFRSINAHAGQKRFELRRTGDSAEIQNPHNGGNGQWRSANKRGSTSVNSRSWPIRDSAITRRHACSSIA